MPDDKVEDAASVSAETAIQALKDDLKALRADLTALLSTSKRAATGEARRQTEKVGLIAEGVAATAEDYRTILEDEVRSHPLAAVGIALVAGMFITSMNRRD